MSYAVSSCIACANCPMGAPVTLDLRGPLYGSAKVFVGGELIESIGSYQGGLPVFVIVPCSLVLCWPVLIFVLSSFLFPV
jgi:hypothetical protein